MDFYTENFYLQSPQPPPVEAVPATLSNLFRWMLTATHAVQAEIDEASTHASTESTIHQFRKLPDAVHEDGSKRFVPLMANVLSSPTEFESSVLASGSSREPRNDTSTPADAHTTTDRQPVIATGVLAGIAIGAAAALTIVVGEKQRV